MTTAIAVLMCLASPFAQAPPAAAAPSAPPITAADPKLVAIVEQNKAGFEKCMADNIKKYPNQDPKVAAEEKKLNAKKDKSIKDLERLLAIATQDGERLSNRLTGAEACVAELDGLVKARLKDAGADDAASAAALEQWKTEWYKAHP